MGGAGLPAHATCRAVRVRDAQGELRWPILACLALLATCLCSVLAWTFVHAGWLGFALARPEWLFLLAAGASIVMARRAALLASLPPLA
eukprot:11659141-Alexandrium_andersonii.AAC.1